MFNLFLIIFLASFFLISCDYDPLVSLQDNPKVDPLLVEYLKNTSLERVHVFIQFSLSADNYTFKEVEDYNVSILNYVEMDFYSINVPIDKIGMVTQHPKVIMIKKIPLETKFDGAYPFNEIPPLSLDDNGNVNVIVVFHNDISEEEAFNVASKYSQSIQSVYKFGTNQFHLKLSKESIIDLAKEDSVLRIGFSEHYSDVNFSVPPLTIITDKEVYELGESVNITVNSNLDVPLDIVLGPNQGEPFTVSKYENGEFKDYPMNCAYGDLEPIKKNVQPHDNIIFEWDQKAYVNPFNDCRSKYLLGEGVYKVKIMAFSHPKQIETKYILKKVESEEFKVR